MIDYTFEDKFTLLNDNDLWVVDMQYSKLDLINSIDKCIVRVSLVNMLEDAACLLPDGYRFKIWDAWRPFNLQEELYYKYKDLIIKKFNLLNYSEEKQVSIIKKFVSIPKKDLIHPPMHTTGGAIDITIIDKNNNELNMGTHFDEFSDKTQTNFFNNRDKQIDTNRKLLLNVMTEVGFVNFPSEWWHFDYGDHYWASVTNNNSIYSGVYEESDLLML